MIILRLDDVGMDDEQFQMMHKIITGLKIPCTYAVVPYYLNEQLAKQISKSYIENVMHGYRHENHGKEEKAEFCDGRSYEKQLEDLKRAGQLFEQYLPKTGIFVPPWHHCNEDTANVLKQLSFTHLSLSEREKERREGRLKGFYNSWMHVVYDPTDHEDDVLLLKKVLALSKQHYAGILLHHNLLKSEKAIQRTRQFLTLLKRSAERFNIKFKTLSQL